MSGIDTDILNLHSTRSASSSRARFSCSSLSDILRRGSWSNKTTCDKFYNKPTIISEEKFQKDVKIIKALKRGEWATLLHCHEVKKILYLIETEI